MVLILSAISVQAAPPPPPNQKQTMSESAHQIKFNLRRLWMEHAIWTVDILLAQKQIFRPANGSGKTAYYR
jgi:hypothetical protein